MFGAYLVLEPVAVLLACVFTVVGQRAVAEVAKEARPAGEKEREGGREVSDFQRGGRNRHGIENKQPVSSALERRDETHIVNSRSCGRLRSCCVPQGRQP